MNSKQNFSEWVVGAVLLTVVGVACIAREIPVPLSIVILAAVAYVVLPTDWTIPEVPQNARTKHAEHLYEMRRASRRSLLSRLVERLRDTRDWRSEFVPGRTWWHGGSLIEVENFNGRALIFTRHDGAGGGTLKRGQWSRLVRA
jgi:hypothetical protein